MRRSSKGSQLINQSGHDDTYKFRCMEYLNFVLDQIVNLDNRFKLYTSHIEVKSLFRKESFKKQPERHYHPRYREDKAHA